MRLLSAKARTWLVSLLFLVSISWCSSEQEDFKKYDAEAIKRFDDELRRLGVVSPSLSVPDEPTELSPPIATAPAGDFEGHWTKSQFGRPIAAFEGIPYAQPPVGPLRFKVAQPAPRMTGFKAKKPGSICTQRDVYFVTSDVEGQEDCLFINVYVPQKVQRTETELLPVMFWVHGGGFVSGSGDLYQSNLLLDKDVVFVTFNYRLGTLGFFTTEDGSIPANLGLKDQVAALRWVHENIAAFGGNPSLVTVFGQSAGGASTEFLMLSPLTRGLIHRVIPMSGTTMGGWNVALPDETWENQQKVAEYLGCPSRPSSELLACLQTKPAQSIAYAEVIFKDWGRTLAIPFKPVVEGDVPGAFLPYHPKKLYADGPSNDVPYMTGVTSEDGSFLSVGIFTNETLLREFDENFLELAPRALYLTKPNEKSRTTLESLRKAYFGLGPFEKSHVLHASNIFTDAWFFWPMVQSLHAHATGAKAPAFVYYFNYKGSRSYLELNGFPGDFGVSHGDELQFVFPFPGTPSPADVYMAMIFTDLLTSFARDGVPSLKLLPTEWLPTTSRNIGHLHIKSPFDMTMKDGLLVERWTLLKKLFDSVEHKHDDL